MPEIQAIASTYSHIIVVNVTRLDLNGRHLPAEVSLKVKVLHLSTNRHTATETNTNSPQQHVNEPALQNNILDLVLTTADLSINRLEVTDKIGDHQIIDFTLEVYDPNSRKQVLDYKLANFELLMKEELGSINYEVLMRNKNAEECDMILKEKITTATEHHVPTKRMKQPITPLGFPKKLNASTMQDNIHTEDLNNTKQNSIVKNISAPAGLLSER
ncbi:hypothetical protein FHG87_004002 [Trinorchestia longiramus]|nr:hypothetical protein FHG87_004002 [Trinorchestia longiramus]